MKQATRDKLAEAWAICKHDGKSLEYTIQFMQDYAGVGHDCVMNWLYDNRTQPPEEGHE